jgi:hypothetical protein
MGYSIKVSVGASRQRHGSVVFQGVLVNFSSTSTCTCKQTPGEVFGEDMWPVWLVA